jgi:hypothetical protein
VTDPDEEARFAEIAERKARRARLTEAYGKPERISAHDAAVLAATANIPVSGGPTEDDIVAHIYRDNAAADGWLDSNLLNHGHPTLAKVPLLDGRVVGILDLRPALKRLRELDREEA